MSDKPVKVEMRFSRVVPGKTNQQGRKFPDEKEELVITTETTMDKVPAAVAAIAEQKFQSTKMRIDKAKQSYGGNGGGSGGINDDDVPF